MGEWMSWGKASWGVFSTCLQCCYKLIFFTCILLSVTVIIKKQTNKKTKNKVNFLRLGIFLKKNAAVYLTIWPISIFFSVALG